MLKLEDFPQAMQDAFRQVKDKPEGDEDRLMALFIERMFSEWNSVQEKLDEIESKLDRLIGH